MSFQNKKLNEQTSVCDCCEFMSQFAPDLGRIAGPKLTSFLLQISNIQQTTYELCA
jgi:hypothetical protein